MLSPLALKMDMFLFGVVPPALSPPAAVAAAAAAANPAKEEEAAVAAAPVKRLESLHIFFSICSR